MDRSDLNAYLDWLARDVEIVESARLEAVHRDWLRRQGLTNRPQAARHVASNTLTMRDGDIGLDEDGRQFRAVITDHTPERCVLEGGYCLRHERAAYACYEG